MKKNKRKYQVFAKDGQHEYTIKVKDTKKGKEFKLFLSKGDQWHESAKGKLELTMLDTGSGVIFTPSLGEIPYEQLTNARLLMGLERKTDTNPLNREKFKAIHGKTVIKL
jgi:hypothetical protein